MRSRTVAKRCAQCPHVPRRTPTVDLSRAQSVYQRLITEHPRFRKIDTVIYLYGFSLRDQGKTAESVKYFQIILDRFPRSRYVAQVHNGVFVRMAVLDLLVNGAAVPA